VPVIGVTGGIATGKSTLTRSLAGRLSAEAFDADSAVHILLREDRKVRVAIESAFGPDLYSPDGEPHRSQLRALVFSDDQKRAQLEAILLPAVRAQWLARAEAARREGIWLLVDIPLLYETAAESHCDRVVVVACSGRTQRQRLGAARGLDPELAQRIIAAQLDLQTKISKADHVIWNDSTISSLEAQGELLANWLSQTYGRNS
jgi:dephospho-CoA kinase